ncbi:hypothetical protein FFLO_05833 [Filobasidium floriforme]|uniref:Multifunctional methyltransferase subunit TRM112 n=1 Tax=Filobasidium floriforme TaxID=5210 RepID=A0A8K0JID7_9TREE|nr:hypothetical protein FFLO_05833 [Filobasidium floriforme]
MVRLITHNMLTCHVKNCTKDNFPLVFENVELEVRPAEANLDFIKRFIPKLEWDALVQTARSIGEDSLPEQMPEDKATLESEEFLQKLHHVLMEIHVEEGQMKCRGCGHIYPISTGIPNMLLAEHEVGR